VEILEENVSELATLPKRVEAMVARIATIA
jgi:hypothetical protein